MAPRVRAKIVLGNRARPTLHRIRGAIDPRDKREDDIGGWGIASELCQRHHPRGPSDPRLCVIVSHPAQGRSGEGRTVFWLGDAALAAPRTTTGPPAASPRSSTPGGEPAYSNRRQQVGTDSLMSRAQSWPPDPIADNQLLPAPWVRDHHRIRALAHPGIRFFSDACLTSSPHVGFVTRSLNRCHRRTVAIARVHDSDMRSERDARRPNAASQPFAPRCHDRGRRFGADTFNTSICSIRDDGHRIRV